MSAVVPLLPRFQFSDALGVPLAGGTVDVYEAGSTTRSNSWQDRAQTILNTNPIVLDANGACTMWLDSSLLYKIVVSSSGGVVQPHLGGDNIPGSSSAASLISFLQTGTGAVTRDAQEKMRDFICILDFIPVAEHAAIKAGTSTYDCSTALTNAIASRTVRGLGLQILTGGPQIYFPAGKYFFASTQHLKIACHLKGERAGLQSGWSTHFVFPAGVAGFVVHKENTDSTGTVAATTGADGTVFEDILFYGTSRVGFPNAHGLWMRARAAAIRCTFQAFGGNGIHILASAGAGGFIEGNANCFYIENSAGLACGGHGLFVDGADSNAGTVVMFDGSLNDGWGIYDSSFLGNTYVGCHCADNITGPYKTDSANARNVFIGCYAEGGQPPSEFVTPTLVLGGLQGSSVTAGTTAMILDMDVSGAVVSCTFQVPSLTIGKNQAATSGTGLVFKDTGGTSSWSFDKAVGRWGYKWSGAGTPGFINFYDQTATVANGYARDLNTVNGAIGIGEHYFGSTTEMRKRGLIAGSAGVPASGTHIVGDSYEYASPVAGGFIGVVCVTAGSPGTFKTYGPISP